MILIRLHARAPGDEMDQTLSLAVDMDELVQLRVPRREKLPKLMNGDLVGMSVEFQPYPHQEKGE